MAISSTPTTEHFRAVQRLAARRSTLLRVTSLIYVVFAVAYLLVGTPFTFRDRDGRG